MVVNQPSSGLTNDEIDRLIIEQSCFINIIVL